MVSCRVLNVLYSAIKRVWPAFKDPSMSALYSRLRQPNRVTYTPKILLFEIVQAHYLLVCITERAGFQKTLKCLELWYILYPLPSD